MRTSILFVLSATLLPAQQPAAADPAQGVNFYSLEREIALGRTLANDVVRQARMLDDPGINEYLNDLTERLRSVVDTPLPVTVRVIEDASFNSMALPGGWIFVNTGLLEAIDTEAELAAVLAHQLGHVAARHGTKADTRGQIANLAFIPLIFQGGWTGYGVRQDAQLAIPLGFLTFSRGFETEADSLGLQYLDQSGYDPNAFIAVFERVQALERRKKGTINQLFSTHPLAEDRIARTREGIATLEPRADAIVTTPEFDGMKARLVARPKPPAPPNPTIQRFL